MRQKRFILLSSLNRDIEVGFKMFLENFTGISITIPFYSLTIGMVWKR